jgi:hypothetical protein
MAGSSLNPNPFAPITERSFIRSGPMSPCRVADTLSLETLIVSKTLRPAMPKQTPPPASLEISPEPAQRSKARPPEHRGLRVGARLLAEAQACRNQIAILRRHLCELRGRAGEQGVGGDAPSDLDDAIAQIENMLESCERSLAFIPPETAVPPASSITPTAVPARACR